MKKRNWAVKEKLAIVLRVLKKSARLLRFAGSKRVSQKLYYRLCDKLEAGKKGLVNGFGDDRGGYCGFWHEAPEEVKKASTFARL